MRFEAPPAWAACVQVAVAVLCCPRCNGRLLLVALMTEANPQQDDAGNPVIGLALTTATSANVRAGDYAVQALSNRTTAAMLVVR